MKFGLRRLGTGFFMTRLIVGGRSIGFMGDSDHYGLDFLIHTSIVKFTTSIPRQHQPSVPWRWLGLNSPVSLVYLSVIRSA